MAEAGAEVLAGVGALGLTVGAGVGAAVGARVGGRVGDGVGAEVGAAVFKTHVEVIIPSTFEYPVLQEIHFELPCLKHELPVAPVPNSQMQTFSEQDLSLGTKR